MEGLKEGTVICLRDWNYYNNTHNWEFQKVKKITPTGKIRLENGDLLNSLGKYRIYDKEMQKLYIQDKLQKNVMDMVYYIANNKENIFNELPFEDILKFGDLLEELNIDKVDKWNNATNKKFYKDSLDKFVVNRNRL